MSFGQKKMSTFVVQSENPKHIAILSSERGDNSTLIEKGENCENSSYNGKKEF